MKAENIITEWNNSNIKDELHDLINASDTKSRIDILINIVLEYRQNYPEDSILLSDEIIAASASIDYQMGLGEGYNHKGACYWIIGEYELGLDELNKANDIAKKNNFKSLLAKVYNNFGRIYRELGDIASALSNFENSVQINEELGNELNLTINLTNISQLYYDLGDYDTALESALRSVPIFEKKSNDSKLVSAYHHLGNIYFKQEDLSKASKYFELVLEKGGEQVLYKAMAYAGLGKVFYLEGNIQAAKEYLNMSLVDAEITGSFETKIIAHFYLSKVYYKTNDFDKALNHALRGYNLSKEYGRKHDEMSIHEMLSLIYDKKGDIPNAYHHLKQFEEIKETIFQQTTLNNLRNLQIKNQILFAKKDKEVAEKTAQLKQQFMANMSHEIRTPLNAISGLTNILLEKNPQEEQLKYLKAIKVSSDNLLNIINDILDIAKIEAGKIILERLSINLKLLTESIIESLYLKAEEKGIFLNHTTDQNIPDRIFGDPTRISQILINLIGNAIKFTDKGGVTLHTKIKNITSNTVSIIFQVKDTGIGIEENYVANIFESFTQAGTDTARKFGGTGLGLTICKELTEMMNGEISVESQLGYGTTFTVEIPFEINNSEEKEEEVPQEFSPLNDLNILLVEDNEFNVLVAQDTILSLGNNISITIANNGEEAIRLLEQNSDYDIVLMDIQMPVMDGIATTKWIRKNENESIKKLKIIALTANVFAEDIRKYYQIGMNGYITKPFRKEELHRELHNIIDKGNKDDIRRNIEVEKIDSFEQVNLDKEITNLDFLKNFTHNNEEKMLKYIRMFRTNAPKLLQNLEEGFKNSDYEQVKIAAHSLKPQLGYMGVSEEVSNIYLLEKSADEEAHHSVLSQLIKRVTKIVNKALEELPE